MKTIDERIEERLGKSKDKDRFMRLTVVALELWGECSEDELDQLLEITANEIGEI